MKKLLLASAVAALSVSAANAAPVVYGKAFLTVDYINAELDSRDNTLDADDDSLQVNSNGSRIGFKGSEPLSANTDVIYKLEYGIDIDGDSGTKGFKRRDNYLGLSNNNYGEVRVGYQHGPLDMINNVVVTSGYWDNLGADNVETTLANYLTMTDSSRTNNTILWKAPQYGNMPIEVAVMYKAEDGFSKLPDKYDDDGFAVSAMYDGDTGFTAGIAYDKDATISGDIIRVTGSYDAAKLTGYPVMIGALYQNADYDTGSEDETGYMVSAELGLENFSKPAAIYAQYNGASDLYGNDGFDSDQFVVGGRYFYQKNMIAHLYAGYNKTDTTLAVASKDTPNVTTYSGGEAKLFAIGGGLEYKF